MVSKDKKMGSLLRSVEMLQHSQTENREEMAQRLDQLEKKVTCNQDKATQGVVK